MAPQYGGRDSGTFIYAWKGGKSAFPYIIIIIIIIIKQILAQVKQIIVTNALYYQLPERNMTVFKRLRNMVNDSGNYPHL